MPRTIIYPHKAKEEVKKFSESDVLRCSKAIDSGIFFYSTEFRLHGNNYDIVTLKIELRCADCSELIYTDVRSHREEKISGAL